MKRFFPFIALAAVTVLSVFSCQQEPEEILVSSISLSKSALELTVGDQASLDATISPNNATNKKISWSSSKESVATVTPEGIVEAVSAGTAFITATLEDNSDVSAKCEITVKEKAIQASVSADASDIQCTSATISGSLAIQSEGSFSKSVSVYYSSSENTLEGLKSNGGVNKFITLEDDGSYSSVLSPLSYSTSYNYVVVAKVDDVEFASIIGNFSTPAPQMPSLVDLGLSVKWASFNLGASKPTGCGGYYQWAGTKDVSDIGIYLDWDNCPYHTGSRRSSGWTKYNTKSSYGTVDNKTVLESMDDAASVVLGGKWRMPTYEEWDELMNTENCSWTWTSIDGVNGYKVQSTKPGYTDNWIFLPAAGCRYYNGGLGGVGSDGSYWSSSLSTADPYGADGKRFCSDYFDRLFTSRYYGLSVRPVSD